MQVNSNPVSKFPHAMRVRVMHSDRKFDSPMMAAYRDEFNALALVPIEGRSFQPARDDRSIANK